MQQPSKPRTARLATLEATDERSPDEEIARIVDSPPVLADHVLKYGARLTRPWRHGAIHGSLPSMTDHVIMTYYGGEHTIALQSEGKRLISRTRPGTITLIPEGHEGRWELDGAIEVTHVYLPSGRLQACVDQLADGKRIELLDRVAFEDPMAARIVELLGREAVSDSGASGLFIEQAIDLLCTQLVRGHSSLGAIADPAPRKGLAAWQVKKVMAYMNENLGMEITLDELAGLLSLSRFHFCTAFRQATGKTPHEALVGLRMETAKRLLRDRLLDITEIALSVGYGTPSSFTAAFRKATGMTPTAFRARR